MRLGTKIIIGFFCISLLLALIGIITNRFTEQVRVEQLSYVNEGSAIVIHTSEMERSLYQSIIFLNAIRETKGSEVEVGTVQELPSISALKNKFELELTKFEQAFDALQQMLKEDKRLPENVKELDENYQVYKSLSREWLQLGTEDFEQANMMFMSSIEPYFRNNIIPQISPLRSYALSIQQERIDKLNESLQRATIANYIATFCSILFAVTLAVYIYRSIANPLSRLNKTTSEIGKGNLDERIQIDSKDEIGELAVTINEMAANLQNKTVSKEFLNNILESIQEALFVTNTEGMLQITNSAATTMLGYTKEEFSGKNIAAFFDPLAANKKEASDNNSFEYSLKTKNGKEIPVIFSEADLIDTKGDFIGCVFVASDISSRIEQEERLKESLQEKEVLLAEIHHRVKNNLAVISGLLQLQSFKADNDVVKEALTESQLRIQSIALVHEMLYQNESLAFIEYDKYVNDLLQAISSMHMSEEKDISLVSSVQPVSLSVNQAIPSSLLLNELIVNSYKHAFTDRKKGRIEVELNENNGTIHMQVSDDGDGFDINEFKESDSLGASLIRTLCKQLQGEYEFASNSEDAGTMFTVQFEKKE
ncbi:MAG: HAMP domain-containing protein [Balneolaceae bacterium]|nr:HAMP domain-containing protein [Balneolaceae bacterium]